MLSLEGCWLLNGSSALKTPQILELSGIGRKAVLDEFEIPTVIDLPVGENIQEHIYLGMTVRMSLFLESFTTPVLMCWHLELKDDVADATLDDLLVDGGLQKHIDLL